MSFSLNSAITIPSLLALILAGPVNATDFVFAPAPVTGEFVSVGEGSGNIKLTFLTVDSESTTITGLGGSVAARRRIGQYFGLNFAGNILVMEDDAGTFTATSINLLAGPDIYLSENVIAFVDGSIGSTTSEIDTGFSSSSSTVDITGFSYGIQLILDINDSVKLTPYFMALEQTASTDGGIDVDISSSVIGLDVLINRISLAAMFQSSDDTDIVMFSVGTTF